MIHKSLEKLGFSPSEISIYLQLLKNGCSYANRLSRETRINRSNVYEALDRLTAKGVVSFVTKNKSKWFEAKPPEYLHSLINEKEDELKQTKKELKKTANYLNSFSPPNNNLEANIFTGKKGLRMLFEEILESKKTISLIAAELQFKKFFGPYFELWHKQRIKKRIIQRSIFPKLFKNKVKKRSLLKYKFVENKYTNPTTTIIFGDSCIFIQWTKEPIAIKIQNKEITKSHLNYFNMLWKS